MDTNENYTNQDNDYYVYILKCSDGTLYTGMTNDPVHRLKVHNQGLGSKYTRVRRPVSFVYIESGLSKSDALKRERNIKKMTRQGKLKLIEDKDLNEIDAFLNKYLNKCSI